MENDDFWDDLQSLVGRDPEMRHGTPVLKDERGELTRLSVDDVVGNVDAYMELEGMTEEQAIAATMEVFPHTPGGADTLRKLLAYQDAHLNVQPAP